MDGGRGVLSMRPSFVWLMFVTLAIAAFAELLSSDPHLPPYLVGATLLLIGILAGLRWGTDAATRLIADLSRTNSYLAEQNDELSELNYELLSRLNEADVQKVERE
jgi:hypothetical protein